MTPAARLQAAIDILTALDNTAQPADRFLREWLRTRRYAGSKDRAAVGERIYDVLRHRAQYGWRMGSKTPRALVLASLLAEGGEVENLFSGNGYGPESLTEDERAAIANMPKDAMPNWVQGEYPQWLEPDLIRAFGADMQTEMAALAGRAPVDLRVNRLKAERPAMLAALHSLGIEAEVTPYAPDGIRVPSAAGLAALSQSEFFLNGAYEFQDEASQMVALLCAPKPGNTVLDLAAGAGGKSLALAALMQNQGRILAFDDDPRRLKPLGPRTERAGATIIEVAEKRGGPLWGSGLFDVVLVDAPCSGSGTWRRAPELKWRLTPERLSGLTPVQTRLLEEGARHVKPGGRLVYATCSILPPENEERVEPFLASYRNFKLRPARDVWEEMTGSAPPPGMETFLRASPARTGTDGFFVAVFDRT
jgi:16S rRNA (cytosine967-C5)-methyltransferase